MHIGYAAFTATTAIAAGGAAFVFAQGADSSDTNVLQQLLKKEGFTGRIEETLPARLGRPIDTRKADLGRLIFFDKGLGLHKSNSCAGCHSPTHGFGDTQSIARGIQNNNVVGAAAPPKGRDGPRNQRRTPTIVNSAFYPVLMWNGRFSAASGDPFDNSKGFVFPPPEGEGLFFANDPRFQHLLVAQAHIPFTEQPEMAGFSGLQEAGISCQTILPKNIPFKANIKTIDNQSRSQLTVLLFNEEANPDYCQFNDGQGTKLPHKFPDTDVLNAPIRHQVLQEINQIEGYRKRFSELYPQVEAGNGIEFWMIGQTLAEFQLQQTFAKAPIDRFATGDTSALSSSAKRGAILFFGKAACVTCHAVGGQSNEMFSDFKMHNAGVPQIFPIFGKSGGKAIGNVAFRSRDNKPSPIGVLDYGRFEFEDKKPETAFMFRTSPLRNVSLQPAFFHNGSFTKLEDAIRFHIDTIKIAKTYEPAAYGVASDLQKPSKTTTDEVLKNLNPYFLKPLALTDGEITDLIAFLSDGLLDPRAKPAELMRQIPTELPSGAALPTFVPP